MSRKFKTVTLGDKKITVRELTVKDIKDLWADITGGTIETTEMPMFANDAILKKHWDRCVEGVSIEETDEYAPSELKVIYDAFAEVNEIFFDLSLKLEGENVFIKSLRVAVANNLMLRFVASLKEDTETSSNTDTASS